jgi:hypothetical protein
VWSKGQVVGRGALDRKHLLRSRSYTKVERIASFSSGSPNKQEMPPKEQVLLFPWFPQTGSSE